MEGFSSFECVTANHIHFKYCPIVLFTAMLHELHKTFLSIIMTRGLKNTKANVITYH